LARPRILVAESDRFTPRAKAILQVLGELELADLDRSGLLREAGDAEVLWVRLRHHVDAGVMARAPRLKFIVSATTGLNHIDLVEAERRGIRVMSLRGEVEFLREIRATAEHTIALALALLRHLPKACEHVQAGGWNRDLFWGRELHRKTVGIVGYGRLGRIVGDYFGAFGVGLLVSDPAVHPQALPPSVQLVPLDNLLQTADLITIHVNLSDSTRCFFGHGQFSRMKAGAWFVNTARGELVDELALIEALQAGHLAGAAVDVLSGESSSGMGSHPLVQYARTHDNLLITPHIGGCTFESVEKTEVFLAEKLRDHFSSAVHDSRPSTLNPQRFVI
jgi:D-3-phosphoglycerate dehydrogenase